jgi:hypothetical protein
MWILTVVYSGPLVNDNNFFHENHRQIIVNRIYEIYVKGLIRSDTIGG